MEEMPKLTKCTLLTAFKCVESVRMRNAGRLEEMEVLVNAKKENEEERKTQEREIGRFRVILLVMREKEEKREKVEVDEGRHEEKERIVGRVCFVAYAKRHPS